MPAPAAGYSGTPLVKKLGIKPGARILLVQPPRDYLARLVGPLPEGARVLRAGTRDIDFAQLFVTRASDLDARFPKLRDALTQAGMLWVSWPKRSSGVETDVDENVVRATGLRHGLVDVKVCAVDETWSGLKFVRRLKDRN